MLRWRGHAALGRCRDAMPDDRNCTQPAIGDYALIGDRRTAALVSRAGSVDWLCLPRFDSQACFARLLGHPEHGYWQVAPDAAARNVRRRYRPETLILETEIETAGGRVLVTDFMPEPEDENRRDLVRIVRGLEGSVT